MDPVTILEIIQMFHRGSGKKGGLGMLGIKNLLALIGLVVVVFVGVGWYLGWYKIGEQTDAQGHPQLKIQVDSSQVAKDLKKAEQEVIESLDKTKAAMTPAPGQPPVSTPGQPNAQPAPVESQVHQQAPLPPPAPLPSQPQGGSWIFPPAKNVP